MTDWRIRRAGIGRLVWLLLGLAAMGLRPVAAEGPAEMARQAAWETPSADEVRAQALAWLDQQALDEEVRARAEAVWAGDQGQRAGPDLLARLAQCLALGDPRAGQLVAICSKAPGDPAPPSQPWLLEEGTAPLVANNLRLVYGRWLVQGRLYDEAATYLDGLEPDDVVDPPSLLFYQAVVHHRLLDQAAGLKTLQWLLDGADRSPRRYVAVARLMQADLEGLKEDTLDHIARRMDDIHRRLDLGRAGPRVQEVQRGVIESLDKLIEELEEQRRQEQAASSANQLQSQAPAQDSRILGGRGRGEVVKRNIGSQSGWGNLPPKEREQALQQIGREFPAHYRDAIEQYFRKLAREEHP